MVFALLAAMTLFGAAARGLPMDDPLWLDELHTSWVAGSGLSEVAPRAAIGNQPPLYFYGVWAVTQVFGQSELSLRLISLVAGILLIPAAFLVARDWTGSAVAGLVACALVATETQFLFYSTEARAYALAQLVGLIQIAFFARVHIFRQGRELSNRVRLGETLALIVSSVALFYLHYTTALLFVAEAVAFMVLLLTTALKARGLNKVVCQQAANIARDFAVVTVCCLPALPHMLAISERRQQWDTVPTVLPMDDVWRAMFVCISVPALLTAATAIVRLTLKRRLIINRPDPPTTVLTLAWMLVPAVFIFRAKQLDWANLIHLRYIIVTATAPMVLAALICVLALGRRVQAAIALLVVVAALLTAPWLAAWRRGERSISFRNEDWRAMAVLINENEVARDQPVFVCSNLAEDGRLAETDDPDFHEYCLFSVSGIHSIDRSQRTVYAIPANHPSRFAPEHIQQIKSSGGAWLVVRGPAGFADFVKHDLVMTLRKSGLKPREHLRRSYGSVTAIWIGLS